MRAWVAWVLIVFGLFALAAASHEEAQRIAGELRSGTLRLRGVTLVRALRAYLADEQDAQRYLAYDDAVLGRPYQPYFVRSLAAWQAEASPLATEPDTDATRVSATRALVPYRDFAVEYPPAFFLFSLPPGLFSADVDGFRLLFTLWMAVLVTTALWITTRIARRPAFAGGAHALVPSAAAAALCLGVVVTHRYDAAVALLLAWAAWAALDHRPVSLGLALGLVAATKGIPALVAPAIGVWLWREARRRELLVAAVVGAATLGVFVVPVLLLAPQALLTVAAYHAGRPLQLESTAAAICALFARGGLSTIHSYGSINLVGAAAARALSYTTLLTPLFVIGALALGATSIARAATRERRERALIAAMILPLVAFMVAAKVFSPQYLVWLLPLALVASCARGGAAPWAWIGVCLASQLVYPIAYHALARLEPWATSLLLARNVALACWAILLLRPRVAQEVHGSA